MDRKVQVAMWLAATAALLLPTMVSAAGTTTLLSANWENGNWPGGNPMTRVETPTDIAGNSSAYVGKITSTTAYDWINSYWVPNYSPLPAGVNKITFDFDYAAANAPQPEVGPEYVVLQFGLTDVDSGWSTTQLHNLTILLKPANYGTYSHHSSTLNVNSSSKYILYCSLTYAYESTNPEFAHVTRAAYFDNLVIKAIAPVPGDANHDSKVDFADYLILEATFGSAPTEPDSADFDGNGVVEFADYLVLEANFGTGSVPEPMTVSLLGLGALALIRRRRN